MFKPPALGRRPRFCSAACRQKAYRKRLADPFRLPKKLLDNDIRTFRDRIALRAKNEAELREVGYDVILLRPQPAPKRPKSTPSKLKLVASREDPAS
jgi:hypothetical protein